MSDTTRASLDTAGFEDELRARGCTDVVIVEWPPGRLSERHVHDFRACGLILDGEYTLETPDGARVLRAGDRFELARGIPHVERVSATGVRILAGRLQA